MAPTKFFSLPKILRNILRTLSFIIFLKKFSRNHCIIFLLFPFSFQSVLHGYLRLFVASSSCSFRKRSRVPKHWSWPINFACRRWLMGNEGTEDRKGSRCTGWVSLPGCTRQWLLTAGGKIQVALNYCIPNQDPINSLWEIN